MKSLKFKNIISLVLAIVMIVGAISGVNTSAQIKVSAENTVESVTVWSGNAASSFANGSGTQEDPYIIETADQLYLALTQITDTTNSVAGGKQTSKILKQGSSTEYVPVYSPNYYKVSDYVSKIYLNDIVGSETLEGIKVFVNGSTKKVWNPNTAFVGNLDGNGVTVYGMYSSNGKGFVGKLDGTATIKNFNFDSCYSSSTGNAAIVTTLLGSYANDSTIHTIANISVRNSFIASTRNITVTQRTDNTMYNHNPGAAGIVSTTSTCENLIISNCLFDGVSCERIVSSTDGVTSNMIGAIISGGNSMNNVEINNCVALGAPVVDEVCVDDKEVWYSRYGNGFQVFFNNSYSTVTTQINTKYPDKYNKLLNITRVETKNEYIVSDMPGLNWRDCWQLVTVYDNTTRVIPMPKINSNNIDSSASYAKMIAAQNNNGGAYNIYGGAYYRGTYGMYYDLQGSGTEEDPYLISNAFQLARAIASGGVNVYNKLYYKLTCDIDASEGAWITQDAINVNNDIRYKYIPFSGVLDGDGHVVTNLYVGDDQSVGLIPVLAKDGVVKNIHIRDGYFISGSQYAGAIVGETQQGATIIGCSAENTVVASAKTDSHIVGNALGSIKNAYYIATQDSTVTKKVEYYDANGNKGDIDVSKNSDVWYLGGKNGSTPRLKNQVVASQFADINGDGVSDTYDATDLVALRRNVLRVPEYENIYGDINRDGEINITDIAVLSRIIIGDYDKIYDGFWQNANLGKIKIYYGENDNYDAARRLEIYLESQLPNVDIKKVVSANKTVTGTKSDSSAVYVHANDSTGTPTGELEIIVGNIENYSDYASNSLATNDYAITYNESTGVLWFKGGSFTGVEQAVIDFITNSNEKTSSIYTVDNATLAPEKWAKTVMVDTNYDGVADTQKVMYYAWGDEFDGVEDAGEGENSLLNLDIWNHQRMRTETEAGKSGNYNNVESVNEKELSKLYWVEDGKLTITRGVKASHATAETDSLGYVRLYEQEGSTAFSDSIDDEDVIANPGLIKANHSMLWKQGYAEMYGSLPSDGHVFASWWMLGHGSLNNYAMDETLYAKVYKRNNTGAYAYDGTSTWPESTDPTTYKYQVPTNYFEIDIWELMQNPSLNYTNLRKTKTTGTYEHRLYLNVHKFYSVGARNQATVNVIDWDNPGTPRAVMQKDYFGSKEYYFSTSAKYHDFTDGSTTRYTKDFLGRVTANYKESLQKQLTAPRRYGFYWSTNGVDKFNFTLYIYDLNGDGIEDDNAILGTSDMTYNTDSGKKPSDYDCVDDAEVANQYMYFLIDNILYTSNPNHNNSTSDNAVMHTDMLVNNGTAANPDKITLEYDYLRVYQYDGRRDIITRETESFNNGNHFGY
ncbi:MAG: dockerin type I repeat-containing protein [Clostridia bacterium]|nr:dockerin type I repeat-containing protein [Clostridia bacterium]